MRAYAVEPDDWPAYQEYLRQAGRDQTKDSPPGTQVLDKRLAIRGDADAMVETVVDLC